MAGNGSDLSVGLYIHENSIRAVISDFEDGEPHISGAYSGFLEYPLNVETVKNRDLVPAFSRQIEEQLSRNVAMAGNIRLAIDENLVLTKKISVDQDLTDEEIMDHVEWELEQFLIASRDQYNVGFERGAQIDNGLQQIIIVCARKILVDYLGDIFSSTPFTLSTLDVNLFSIQRSLKKLYPEQLGGLSLLMSFERDQIDLLLLKEGVLAAWGDIPRNSGGIDIFEHPESDLIGILKDEFQLVSPLLDREKITTIFFDGNVESELIENIAIAADNPAIVKIAAARSQLDGERPVKVGSESILAALGMTILNEEA